MDDGPHQPGPPLKWLRQQPGFLAQLTDAAAERASDLADRGTGTVVTDHRSSWVRKLKVGREYVYIKVYDYPTRRDRSRGIGRTTLWANSRAAREWDALRWLRAHDFAAPQPLGVAEARRFGVLWRAVLVTAAWPGEPVDALLAATTAASERTALVAEVRRFVARLHRAGFRDRNLDLRNFLARRTTAGFEVAKIDSPRYRLVTPGNRLDRLARQDLARLAQSLRASGIADD